MLQQRLGGLDGGQVRLTDVEGTWHLQGDGDAVIDLTVHSGRFYRRVLFGGALGAAASYIDGDWDCNALAALLRLLLRNQQHTGRFDRGAAGPMATIARAAQAIRANTRTGSRRNIRDHYDLGNELFRLFLDDSMTYSAGLFETADASLEQAQTAKLDRICRKLDLQADHHVLEIGTGWGSFALHAARHYGCRVTTTTISTQQYELARERVQAAGLEDRVEVLAQDYRDLSGQYDRLVSIEMIEAVGADYLARFFRHCSERLRPEGAMLLQVITTGEADYPRYRRSVDFIQRYVFPGSHCPAPSALFAAIASPGDLRPVHLEDIGEHYVETLRHWRSRFQAATDSVRGLGYPERFLRLWDYYLQYCEAGFAEHHIGDLQLYLAKPDHPTPTLTASRSAR